VNPTIMLVDDDPNLLDSLKRVLHKEPYDIVTACSGKQALEIMSARTVDVVISDEEMPGMSGTFFLSLVRQRYPDTVRFILTGKATLNNALSAINNGGVSRFFMKPCNSVDLIVAIHQGLQHRRLLLAAARLLEKSRRQGALIERLEKEYPQIASVRRDDDGAIPIEELNGDPEQLMAEICSQLDQIQ